LQKEAYLNLNSAFVNLKRDKELQGFSKIKNWGILAGWTMYFFHFIC
jgi:hypothetical protein